MYDFSRCKLCCEQTAAVKYKLRQMQLFTCANCDFHFIDALDEFPDEQPDANLLSEKARSFIEKQLPQNGIQLGKNLQFVKAHIDPSGKQCLDIGSGAGQFLFFLQDQGALPQGIEPQQIFREFAQQKYQLRLRPELVDAPHWQNKFASYFDFVTLWDTLEHVNFPVETLKATSQLIKPGGLLFLDTPSRDSFFYRASEWSYRLSGGAKPALLNRFYSAKPFRHKQLFTGVQLTKLLENSGFTDIKRSALHKSKNKLVVVCRKSAQ